MCGDGKETGDGVDDLLDVCVWQEVLSRKMPNKGKSKKKVGCFFFTTWRQRNKPFFCVFCVCCLSEKNKHEKTQRHWTKTSTHPFESDWSLPASVVRGDMSLREMGRRSSDMVLLVFPSGATQPHETKKQNKKACNKKKRNTQQMKPQKAGNSIVGRDGPLVSISHC